MLSEAGPLAAALPLGQSADWRSSPRYRLADPAGRAVLTALEGQCAGLSLLDTPVWVFDTERCQCLWANPTGLKLWRAQSVADLQLRDVAATQSEVVYTVLNDYLCRVREGEAIASWVTLDPMGATTRTYQTHHRMVLADGRDVLLIEARVLPPAEELLAFASDHSLTVGLYEMDGQFVSANQAFSAISQQHSLHDLNGFLAANGVAATWRSLLEQACTMTFEASIDTERGRRRFQCELRRVLSRAHHFRAVLSLFDTTDQRLAEAERSRLAADSANQAKSQLLATMSHEIRTPMNAIIGLSRLCLQTNLDVKQREYVARVNQSALGLLVIINDILDFSKIDAGKLVLEERPFSLGAILDSLDSMVGYVAREKGLRFETTLDPELPPILLGDPMRLGQVLLNLVSNAVKFTAAGAVCVHVRTVATAGGTVELEFCVRDTGIGLSGDEIGRLFSAFDQADASTTRKYGGTGLGLAISKRLVLLLGGELWVESAVGIGSSFTFTSLFRRGEANAAMTLDEHEQQMLAQAQQQVNGARILVAEDNEFNQQVIQEMLEQCGASVRLCSDGAAALRLLQAEDFDIVLMDVQMPVMDGYAATRAIRATPALTGQRIIAMTANAMGEDRARCLEAGMDDFETKPIDPDRLLLTLAKWLPLAPRLADASAGLDTSGSEDAGMDPGVLDLAVLRRMLKGDEEKVAKFARRFVEVARTTYAEARIVHASRDFIALSAWGHKQKSAAASAGAAGLAALYTALEDAALAHDWPKVDAAVRRIRAAIERIATSVERDIRAAQP